MGGATSTMLLALSIVLGSLIAEDAATITAATFAAMGVLPLPLAFSAALLGIWSGDCALYAVARSFGGTLLEKPWAKTWLHTPSLGRFQNWFRRRGSVAVILSRLFPGTRLPISLTAGLVKMPAHRFATAAVLGAATWVTAAFYLVKTGGARLGLSSSSSWAFGISLAAASIVLPRFVPSVIAAARKQYSRVARWEFWPAWIFYLPVPFMCAWLAVRYRGFSLPACANPAQRNGGIVGESKYEILRDLQNAAPTNVADAYLISAGRYEDRIAKLHLILDVARIEFPFVMKPDVAQRGEGFKKIHDHEQAREYLHTVNAPVIVQKYAAGPHEIGVFYYRFPHQQRGEILAITDKQFPTVTGDGERTLEQLVRADERASLIADVYLQRFESERGRVLDGGEKLRLVEAGNHCQGCIFLDGAELYTEGLRAAVDDISQALPGFYIGRYDIRFATEADLAAGKFTIVELNGAASEATSIYDARNSLWLAYRMLYRQWQLVYAIGAANRRHGVRGPGVRTILWDWLQYRRVSTAYPAAD
jgi:membrane protein DedA with SNARE-associated domain